MPTNSDNQNKLAQSSSSNAERGALVLLALGESGTAGLALKDLASRTGNAKPALLRTLVALGRHGFVERAQGRGRYRLGPAIYALSRRQNSARDKVELWRPALREISDRLGFTTFFTERAVTRSVALIQDVIRKTQQTG